MNPTLLEIKEESIGWRRDFKPVLNSTGNFWDCVRQGYLFSRTFPLASHCNKNDIEVFHPCTLVLVFLCSPVSSASPYHSRHFERPCLFVPQREPWQYWYKLAWSKSWVGIASACPLLSSASCRPHRKTFPSHPVYIKTLQSVLPILALAHHFSFQKTCYHLGFLCFKNIFVGYFSH